LKKRIAILGSTGSIGTQALDVIRRNKEHFSAEVITAQQNADLLIEQALEFKPDSVVITDEKHYQKVKKALSSEQIKVYAGAESLNQVVELENVDMVLTALVGFAGLKPTLKSIKAKKQIALANKETLVVAGELVTKAAKENGVNIYPVDSEHSAIFQCIAGEFQNPIEKIYLTASGGPFRGRTIDQLKDVTIEEALTHPNWNMGAKITIDSATLMNKGFEVIEAHWLFGLKAEQIDVIVHPQSIIHSIVQFADGSMKAQMGLPDMKLPIQYAFGYPLRLRSDLPRFNFIDYPQFTFEKPDLKIFRNLPLAYEALKKGGNMPCIMNAANEIAVASFLEGKIPFLKISWIIEQCMEKISFIGKPILDDYISTDADTRAFAKSII
jgi:1-deoxy-D-xylulose-5-phosphate reductoisomerase